MGITSTIVEHQPSEDIFDPNNWVKQEHEYRIYADQRAQVYAVVDEEDYNWAIRWCWMAKPSRRGNKFYLCRSTTQRRLGIRGTLYLHVEIMKRTDILPLSTAFKVVDHRDGNSLNCLRNNLRWATFSMNRQNLFGRYPREIF